MTTNYTMSNLYLCLLILGFIILAYLRFYTQYIHTQIRELHENVFVPTNAVIINQPRNTIAPQVYRADVLLLDDIDTVV
jgi:hypothetical protein